MNTHLEPAKLSPMPEVFPGATARGPFFVCAATLLTAAAALSLAKHEGWLVLIKKAVALQAPLKELSLSGSPFRLTLQPRLREETEEALGTTEYEQWLVDDLTVPAEKPWRTGLLFITYYTGKPDQVPHVPEECYHESGQRQIDDQTVEFLIHGPHSAAMRVPIRALLFKHDRSGLGTRLFYTFVVNGDYYTTRNQVRARIGDFRERYLYYCKVELSFGIDPAREPKDELQKEAERVLSAVLPALTRSHLRDWPEVMRQQAGETNSAARAD